MVAPLEWGLGHATRCIPLIAALLDQGCEIYIAGDHPAVALLKSEFSNVHFLPLKGYRINLSRKGYLLVLKIFCQLPKITYAVYREHQWLKKTIGRYKLDAVISDNRFGMYHKRIPSVYITHQLGIKAGNWFFNRVARYLHSFFIDKYDFCWVPDFENNGLAGELSHPERRPKNVRYIGALSRFNAGEDEGEKYDLLITVSGPEPQRTLFERLMLENLEHYNGKALLVRGLPGVRENILSSTSRAAIVNHLSAGELCKVMQQSRIIISRSGYTSIMDLVKMNKKAILVPTPGQTEQEYLSSYLMSRKIFLSVNQQDFELDEALEKFAHFEYSMPARDMEQYRSAVGELVQLLQAAGPQSGMPG